MFEDEEDEENRNLNPEKLPIFRKGREIFEITSKIADLISDESSEELKSYKQFLVTDAALLTVKVAGAEGGGLYDIKMEAAAFIRKAAKDLLLHCTGLEMFGFKEIHYLDLIRNSVEEYRLLFIDWVNSFDRWNYVIDRWGLFNPPGVGPFDKDPDEDIPGDIEF